MSDIIKPSRLVPGDRGAGNFPHDLDQGYSIASNVVNNGGPAPLQGYDVGVWVEDEAPRANKSTLLGQFTSIIITFKNASEPYIPVGSRQPIYLDGEMQIAFALEKGLLDALVFQQTVGFRRIHQRNRYIRSPRFKITFAMDPVDWMALDEDSHFFGELIRRYPSGRFVLEGCKIDNFQVVGTSGKSVVATRWEGVAEGIDVKAHTLEDLPESDQQRLNESGQPKDTPLVPTFYFQGFSDQALTAHPYFRDSQNITSFQVQPNYDPPSLAVDPPRQPAPPASTADTVANVQERLIQLRREQSQIRGQLGLLTMSVALNPQAATEARSLEAQLNTITAAIRALESLSRPSTAT